MLEARRQKENNCPAKASFKNEIKGVFHKAKIKTQIQQNDYKRIILTEVLQLEDKWSLGGSMIMQERMRHTRKVDVFDHPDTFEE